MIISVDRTTDFLGTIRQMSADNPFACRITSLYNSYKPDLAFVDYWLIMGGALNFTGAIARSGSTFVLYLTDEADLEEVSSFMRVSGASEILCDGRFSPDFFGIKPSQGVILSKEEAFSDINRDIQIVQPGIRDAYYLIVRCTGKNFQPPKFEDFYVDVNHKLRHNTMRIFGAKSGNKLVSVAMTVAESMYGAVLGAVACDPDFRKQGYASGVVKYLTNSLVAEGKTVYLHRAQNQNERFYSQLGFTEFGTWKEYKLIR